MKIQICKQCGKEYRTKKKNRIFCSVDCRCKSQIKQKKLNNCLSCNTNFKTLPSIKRDFCSRECYLTYHTRNTTQKECKTCGDLFFGHKRKVFCSKECSDRRTERNQIVKTCLCCRKEFKVPRWNSLAKFCSKGCVTSNSNRLRIKSKEDIKCLNCEKIFEVRRYKKNQIFCSINCKNKYQSAERHPMWNGGTAWLPYPYTFTRRFKKEIIERDNHTCLKCNMFEEDSFKIFNKKLAIHHIDYRRENTFKENCCSLCMRCNAEVNINREQWKKFFQSLLSERYGYKYDELGNVVINLNSEISVGEVKNGNL